MHDVVWTSIVLDEFVAVGGLTEDEEKILRTRAKGWSRVKQAMTFGMSQRTVDRIIHSLHVKYDLAQPYSPLLPPRRKGRDIV